MFAVALFFKGKEGIIVYEHTSRPSNIKTGPTNSTRLVVTNSTKEHANYKYLHVLNNNI